LSRDEVMAAIRECARQLGRNPTFPELKRLGQVTPHDIRTHFGTFSRAQRETGLAPKGGGYRVETVQLFLDWAAIARKLGKVPSMSDYAMHGAYSISPLLRRFGNWNGVPRGMRQFAEENGLAVEWADVLSMVREHQQELAPIKTSATPKARLLAGRPVYGPPMAPAGLAHEPVNEAGVIYLFGMVAGRLGYVVTHLQTEFPDCEALREVEAGRWQRIRIEFEFESRNFLAHGHAAGECDLIVCWLHNWPECPLEVVELSKVVNRPA
jgi:Homing endonuclease associated repeat